MLDYLSFKPWGRLQGLAALCTPAVHLSTSFNGFPHLFDNECMNGAWHTYAFLIPRHKIVFLTFLDWWMMLSQRDRGDRGGCLKASSEHILWTLGISQRFLFREQGNIQGHWGLQVMKLLRAQSREACGVPANLCEYGLSCFHTFRRFVNDWLILISTGILYFYFFYRACMTNLILLVAKSRTALKSWEQCTGFTLFHLKILFTIHAFIL